MTYGLVSVPDREVADIRRCSEVTKGSRGSYRARMIEQAVENWHRVVAGDVSALADLLADDVVFYSPVVFTPQRGREITRLYLLGAAQVLGGGEFRYTKQVLAGRHAVLEFETTVDDKHVNGVDIITCNDAGQILEFRVMLRPLQAVNLVHQKMGELLAKQWAAPIAVSQAVFEGPG